MSGRAEGPTGVRDGGFWELYRAERAELEPLLYSIVEQACSLLRGRGGGMYLYDPVHEEAVCVVSYNTPKDYRGVRLKLGEGSAGKVIQTGEPLIIDDYRKWEGRARVYDADQPFTALVSAPMKWGEETIGVIHVLDDAPKRTFSQADLRLLLVFADQAAKTLENALLYRESRRRMEGLAALHRISLKLLAQHELPQLLEEIVRSASELLGADGGGVYLYDRERGELEFVVSHGLSRDYRGTRLRLGEGLAGRVAQSGEPMIIENYRRWEGRSPKYAAEPLAAVISVPLKAKGELVGVLNIHTTEEGRAFTAEDLELAQLFADQAALAIEDARLHGEERRRLQELEALARITRVVSSSLELEEILERALDEALHIAGMSHGGIYLYDPQREELHLKVERGGIKEVVEEFRVHKLGHGLTGRAAAERRPIVCPDLLKEFPHLRELIERSGTRSQISLPLVVRDKLLGVLNLNSSEVHSPSPEELRLLGSIAEVIAVAVENAELYRQIKLRARQNAALGAIGTALSRSLQLEEFLDECLRRLLEAVGYDLGAIYLIEEGEFRLKAHHGLSAEFVAVAARNPLDHYILGRALHEEAPFEVEEFRTEAATREGLKYALYVPIRVRGQPQGVLIIGDRRGLRLPQEAKEVLEIASGHLGAALERIGLHQQLRRSYAQLRAIQRIGQWLTGALDPDEILENLLRMLVSSFDFEVGYFAVYDEAEGAFRITQIYPRDERLEEALRLIGIPDLARARFAVPRRLRPLLEAFRAGRMGATASLVEVLRPFVRKRVAMRVQELYGIRRVLQLPLRSSRRLWGVLFLGSGREELEPRTLRFLRIITGQAAIALERAELYREAVELSDKYGSLVENELLGIYILGEDGRIAYVNQGFVKLFGYQPEELIGRDPLELIHPEDRELIRENLKRRIRGEPMRRPYVFRALRKDGQTLELQVFARRIDYAGRPAVQGVLVDVTRQREAERLRETLLAIAQEILATEDVDRILRRVAEAVVEHSPFQRAAISLYDLEHEPPVEGELVKAVAVGLTPEEEERLRASGGLTPERRKQAFSERFRVGSNSYYIPHDQVPWERGLGVPGRVSLDGWHPDDFLFIPLRSEEGIIGHISVDDPRVPRAVSPEVLGPLEVFAELAALAVERAAYLERIRRQKERLQRAYRIGQALARCRERGKLLELVLEVLHDELDYDSAAVLLCEGEELVLAAAEDHLPPEGRMVELGARIPITQGITGWTVRHRRPVIVDDVLQDPRYLMAHRDVRSELAVPIQLGEEVLGVLNLESRHLGAFKPEDLEFLTAVAAQLAVALGEIRGRERLQQAYSIGQRLAQIEDREKLLDAVLAALRDHFRYEMALILLREGDRLRLVRMEGLCPGSGRRLREIALGRGLTGWAAAHRQSVLVNDVRQDPRYVPGCDATRAELAAPIYTPEELFGVLDIQSTTVDAFTEEDRLVLESLAGQLAIALSNLERRQELRELSAKDPLTGLYNRRHLMEVLERERQRSRRYGHTLALLLIDLDNFRQVNNTYGHLKGDEVLQQIAQLLRENVRSSDVVFRYGGDEFLILMPETDGAAQGAVRRLRAALEEWNRRSGLEVELGFSAGVVAWSPQDGRSIEEVLEEVDRRLYHDKDKRQN